MASNRLLVIDDEPAVSAIIGVVARGCGYDTIITTDPDDFRSRVISWNPTVIVLDLSIPEVDGSQLIVWLAKQRCKARILVVSGREQALLQQAGEVGSALGLNITGTLQKPLRLELLREAFRQIYDAAGLLSIQDISNALINREIRLVYQPQVDLRNGKVVGFEALARWDHPERGPIPPATFIPILEAHELIDAFTSEIMEMALLDMCRWYDATDARLSINVSAANCRSMKIDEVLRELCIRKEVNIHRVMIEVTESAAMADTGHVRDCLERLHESGAQLSIDDFGTGYSSMLKLHQLPFSELKIDRSFVTNCVSDRHSSILVRAMIDLAHNMEKQVVAEGVETQETMDQLREWGCDIAQGYFISKPMPPAEVQAWLQQYTPQVIST